MMLANQRAFMDVPDASPPDASCFGTVKQFAASGAYLRSDEFKLDELISLQQDLDEGDAFLFLKGNQIDESAGLSVEELLRRTPLLLTSQGFYLVTPEAPEETVRVIVQNQTITVIGATEAQGMLMQACI